MKISFSGHETFVCRQFWLKKGFDYLKDGDSFSREDAVVTLGVGKNMVTSIKFWLRGFHIIDGKDAVSELGDFLFNDEDGRDPFLEDKVSLWLLHFAIIKTEGVFIFNSFFNDFTKERNEFTKEHLVSFLKRKTDDAGLSQFSDKTYEADVNVFLRSYVRSNDGKADLEEETANLLIDLNLIYPFIKDSINGKKTQWYRVFKSERKDLSKHLLLFAILDTYGAAGTSVSFYEMLEGFNSPGVIFSLTEQGLDLKLKEIAEEWNTVMSYTHTAGNRVFQIKSYIDKWDILKLYYA